MKILLSIFLMMIAIVGLYFAVTRTINLLSYRARKRKKYPNKQFKKGLDPVTYALYGVAVILMVVSLMLPEKNPKKEPEVTVDQQQEELPPEPPPPEFKPESVAASRPVNWGINWEIFVNGEHTEEFSRENWIEFGEPDEYFALPGIAAFRGNNYRNSASYGTAEVTQQELELKWTVETGSLEDSSWAGSGWTGQPLIVQWDDMERQVMNLYDEKKEKEGLTEVIYACLDGRIYFLDLEDGTPTRDVLDIGMCFKGSGSLDPRGYPIMYVGSGDENSDGKKPRMYIISLIDGSILYEYGSDDELALRKDNGNWSAFDSSPLVDVETDTLIWPGENGLLYTIKLNSQYDVVAGTVSVDPETPVVARYTTSRSSEDRYWYGFEASANIVDEYLYVSENGGLFYCVNLNTMELVWAQDTKDDSNSSPVFERISVDENYIYTAPSLHWTADEEMHGTVNIYKLNAETGEIIWKKPYEVYTVDGVSGGVQASPVLGKQGSDIEGLVIYSVSRTPDEEDGILVALDTDTGDEVWRLDMDAYAWSSPVAVYTDSGESYIIICDAWGYISLVKGSTGELLHTEDAGYLIEASPAVFNDTMVIGTRDQKIYGYKIK